MYSHFMVTHAFQAYFPDPLATTSLYVTEICLFVPLFTLSQGLIIYPSKTETHLPPTPECGVKACTITHGIIGMLHKLSQVACHL